MTIYAMPPVLEGGDAGIAKGVVLLTAAGVPYTASGGGGGGSSLADSSVVDAAGVYWLVRDDGLSLTYIDWATGSSGTPTAPVTPVGGTARQVIGTQYNATGAGTGYSIGDVIEHIVVLNILTSPATVAASTWVNITAGTVLAAPSLGNLAEIGSSVAVTNFPASFGATQSGAWSMSIGGTLPAFAAPPAVAQSGNWDIRNITGTIVLPAGASTAANQVTANTSLAAIAASLAGPLTVVQGSAWSVSQTALPADASPATANITAADVASTTTAQANGQSVVTGAPTANSAASFAISNVANAYLMVSGTWVGTLVVEQSVDGGTTWFLQGVHLNGTTFYGSTFTQNFIGDGNVSAKTNIRVRATAWTSGTATVLLRTSNTTDGIHVSGASAVPIGQGSTTETDLSGTITTGGTAQTIQVATAGRVGFSIQNNSNSDLWFSTTAAAVQSQPSERIPAGMLFTTPLNGSRTGAISIVGATTGQAFSARAW